MTITHERRVLTSGAFKEMPKIVVLCGSTRFHYQFQRANYDETMAGNIVLTVGFYLHVLPLWISSLTAEALSVDSQHGPATGVRNEGMGCTAEQKIALDELHKRKIDLADEMLVLNVGGYIGDSTRSEIEYAEALGMPIRYLEPRSL